MRQHADGSFPGWFHPATGERVPSGKGVGTCPGAGEQCSLGKVVVRDGSMVLRTSGNRVRSGQAGVRRNRVSGKPKRVEG